MSTTPRLGMAYLVGGQADAHIDHNSALTKLDAVVAGRVLSRTTEAQPAGVEGAAYIIPDGATGDDWADNDGSLAFYVEGEWQIYEPSEGMIQWVSDEALACRFVGSTWITVTGEAVCALRRTTSGQTIGTGGTDLEWNVQQRVAGIFEHDTVTDPDQIVLLEAGTYQVMADVTIDCTSGSGTIRVSLGLTLDAGVIAGTTSVVPISNTEDQITCHLTAFISANANQVLRVRATASGAAPVVASLADATRLFIRRL